MSDNLDLDLNFDFNSDFNASSEFNETETFHWPEFLAKTYNETSKIEITEALYFANHLREQLRKENDSRLPVVNCFISNLQDMRYEYRAIVHYQKTNHARMMDDAITSFNHYRHLALKEFQELWKDVSA